MNNKTLCILLLFWNIFSFAQEEDITTGIVLNKNKETLTGASVLLYQEKDSTKIINYSITNNEGKFVINSGKPIKKYLTISFLGYKTTRINLKPTTKHYTVLLEESENSLEEVVIQSMKYRDTIRLKNDTIRFSKNAKLKEILQNNEGVEITEDNGIKFLGVPIHKILINKKEVFVNQNSVALENITNEMIANISVINNYKDKYNVDFDNFNETVINIDVKKQFRGVVKSIIEVGAGVKAAFLLKGKAFLFSDKLNLFVTQNSNSIIDKSNNNKEIINRHGNTSNFFRENITSIAKGSEDVKEDLYNTSYFLLKKEKEKTKLESNLGFIYANQELENIVRVDDNKVLLSEEVTRNNKRGNTFYGDFNITNLISENFSININSVADLVTNKIDWQNNKTIFPTNIFNGNSNSKDRNIVLKNSLLAKKIFGKKWLWENSVIHAYEDSNKDFQYLVNQQQTQQFITYKQRNLEFGSTIFYQNSNLFNYGIQLKFANNESNIESTITSYNNVLDRKLNKFKGLFIVRGQNSRWNYFTKLGPEVYSFSNTTKTTFPISISLNHRISSKKSFTISYENMYKVEATENSIDSTYVNATTLIKSKDFLENIQQTQQAILNYTVANISKSKNISFLLSGTIDKSFSQTNLLTFDTNVNTFERSIFAERKTLFAKHSLSKGIYFSKQDHKIQMGYKVSGTFLDSEVIQNNVLQPLNLREHILGLNIAFIPQNMFFTELKMQTEFSNNNIEINKERINSIGTNKTSFHLNKADGNHLFSVTYFQNKFNTNNTSVLRNDVNLSYRYSFKKDFSFYIKGRNILSLWNSNSNNANVVTNATNGINITTINTTIFGYLIAGIQFKL